MPIAQQTRPNLTTVRQPLREMAEEVIRSVTTGRHMIADKPKHLTFNPSIVARETA
jgi:DNA-binding LacI/PurR family transcriptional regulator